MSFLQQQHPQAQQKHQVTTQNPVKAVQYVCRLLRGYGVCQLSPELLRQAKFDSPPSYQPLLLACHDLVLLVLAGFPPKCAEALTKLRQQLQQEALQDTDGAELSPAGRLLLLHCLLDWGCPAGLIAQLTLPQASSRAALLALCWLIAHAKLFDRALEQLQAPQYLLPFLPPYPQDTSLTAEAQSHYLAVATAAQQHHQHIQQLLQQQEPSTAAGSSSSGRRAGGSSSSSSCWHAVHAGAHHVLATYRSATLRLQQLACLVKAREKLLHDIQLLQIQQQPRSLAQGASNASGGTGRSRGKGTGVLTAFELHLLSHPALLQQHQDALAEAVGLLQQQEACRQHAAVFFAWVSSSIAEAQQQLLGQPVAASSRSSSADSTRSKPAQQQQGQGQAELALPAPPMQDLLSFVQQLPSVGTPLAAGVLSRVQRQLQAAAAAAGIACEQNPASGVGAAAVADQLAQDLAACTIQPGSLEGRPQQLQASVTGACTQAAAAAMVQAGVCPAPCIPELQQLPADVQASLQQLQDRRSAQRHQQAQQLAAQQDVLRHSSIHRCLLDPQRKQAQQRKQQARQAAASIPGLAAVQAAGASVGASVPGSLGSRTQQRSPIAASSSNGCGGGGGAIGASGDTPGTAGVVDVAGELQRLNSLALHVAKLLAKTRAANKQQLAAAAQMLLECGDSAGDGQLVLYQS